MTKTYSKSQAPMRSLQVRMHSRPGIPGIRRGYVERNQWLVQIYLLQFALRDIRLAVGHPGEYDLNTCGKMEPILKITTVNKKTLRNTMTPL